MNKTTLNGRKTAVCVNVHLVAYATTWTVTVKLPSTPVAVGGCTATANGKLTARLFFSLMCKLSFTSVRYCWNGGDGQLSAAEKSAVCVTGVTVLYYSTVPVSYTHLDVYKRQLQTWLAVIRVNGNSEDVGDMHYYLSPRHPKIQL